MMRNCRSLLRVLIVPVIVGVGATAAGEYEITRSTVDGGGALRSTGGTFELSGTIGQPDAGEMSGGTFNLSGGFWFALAPGDLDEDGGVSLVDYAMFVSCLTGPDTDIMEGCEPCDVNHDGIVDLHDFYGLQSAFTRA